MKAFIKENKNQILLCTYAITFGVVALNIQSIWKTIMSITRLLMPLFYGIGIAFVINIPMVKIEKLLKKFGQDKKRWQSMIRSVAIILTLVLLFISLFILLNIIFPKVVESLQMIFTNFGQFLSSMIRNVDTFFKDWNLDFSLQQIDAIQELQNISWQDTFSTGLSMLSGFTGGVINNVMGFTGSFFQWFLGFCLSLYLLSSKEKFIFQLRKVIMAFSSEKVYVKVFEISTKANDIFTKFVGGQLVDCIIKGVMFYIVFIILGYPMPELMAIIIGICSLVPVFGPITAMVIDFILLLALEPGSAIWFIIIFQVLSNLESNIIYPKIVGKSIGLPGIWVLLSIFVLGDMYGIAGMLFAVPLTALCYVLFKELVNYRLEKKKITNQDVQPKK